jgi:factor associated with neutral sphingomyelinase activation
MLHHVGIELFARGGQTLFLVLSSPSKRNLLYDKIIDIPDVKLEQIDLLDVTQKWQNGDISNYEYLMYLNL